MEIFYRGHSVREKEIKNTWISIAKDYMSGAHMDVILAKYKNPKTGKPYTRGHIYVILRKLKNG